MTYGLERDDPELQVFGLVDLAHAAFADGTNDTETPKDKLAWLEASTFLVEEPVETGDWCVKRTSILLFGVEKQLEFGLEFEIFSTSSIDKGCAILRLLVQGGME